MVDERKPGDVLRVTIFRRDQLQEKAVRLAKSHAARRQSPRLPTPPPHEKAVQALVANRFSPALSGGNARPQIKRSARDDPPALLRC